MSFPDLPDDYDDEENEGEPVGRPGNNATASSNDKNNKDVIYKVYPNPAKNELKIRWNQSESGSTLQITDITGRVIYLYRINTAEGDILPSFIHPG